MLLEELICAENDSECQSLLCPVSMEYNSVTGKCEETNSDHPDSIAMMGVVGTVKEMCREGFVWVEWKSLCMRKN